MWLYLIVIVSALIGVAFAIMGLGPVAIIFIVGAIAMLVARSVVGARSSGDPGAPAGGGTMSSTGGSAATGGPQDDEHLDKAHVKTGPAHSGQQRMVPDEEQLPG